MKILLSGEELAQFWAGVHANALAPNASCIAAIVRKGKIAVVVHQPHLEDENTKGMLDALKWTPERPVFAMDAACVAALSQADPVTHKWVLRRDAPGTGRIFLIMEAGTFLLNFGPGGFRLEPGSTDAAMEEAIRTKGN